MNGKAAIFTVFLGITLLLALSNPTQAFADTIMLSGTIRDFCDPAIGGTCIDHPDFEDPPIGVDLGIVLTTLGGDKNPVYAGLAGNPTTTGAANFDQWYNSVAGVNTATPLSITLDNTITADPAIFTFTDSSFFPIDGMLFGNQGRAHNYHFTYEIHGTFTFVGTEMFSFTGDDDVWVFINDKLAIDLGGIHPPLSGIVDLSDGAVQAALGITPGNTYDIDFFFAERHTTESNFRIDTSLAIIMPPMVAGSLTPIDTTMVLVAGAQSISAWMIPVIVAGIGFAIVIARKF